MTGVNTPFEQPDKRRTWLRFNYLTIPYDADANDFYSDDPIVLLVLREVGVWDPNGPDSAVIKELFPNGIDFRMNQMTYRGLRLADVSKITSNFNKTVIIPLAYSYCVYQRMTQATKNQLFSDALAAFKISVLPEQNPDVDFPSQSQKQDRILNEYKDLRSIITDAENKIVLLENSLLAVEQIIPKEIDEIKVNLDKISMIISNRKWPNEWKRKNPLPAYDSSMSSSLEVTNPKNEDLVYLFNVIVALEWTPDEEDRKQLAWAFKQASDFLYDVTNGSLAFGQIIFVTDQNSALAADIVIAASNRFQGRSWVGSIHEPSKRKPLRIGRGEWRNGFSMAWNEPEGYRVIVHEWAHYALHLRDAYLSDIPVHIINGRLERGTMANQPYVTIPSPALVKSTVMEALDGVSELSLRPDRQILPASTERDLIHVLYPSKLNDPKLENSGPSSMRLPLPHIVFNQPNLVIQHSKRLYFDAERITKDESQSDAISIHFRDINVYPNENVLGAIYEECWLYIVNNTNGQTKFVAQGTLERRSRYEPFRLIGAEIDDYLVVVVDRRKGPPDIYKSKISGTYFENGKEMVNVDLRKIIYDSSDQEKSPPMVVVQSKSSNSQDVSIQLDIVYNSSIKEEEIWMCPLMGPVMKVSKQEDIEISSMDGYIVLWCNKEPFISCFSHGGNPPTHTTGYNPGISSVGGSVPSTMVSNSSTPAITAGSSDGMVRIYFRDSHVISNQNFEHLRFVTTVQNDAQGYVHQNPQNGAVSLSYPFNICASEDLFGIGLSMTLEVRYNSFLLPEGKQGEVRICRLDGNGEWIQLPTYQLSSLGIAAAATCFNDSYSYGSQFYRIGVTFPSEQFQLWWIPD